MDHFGSNSPDRFGSVNRPLLPLCSLCPGGCATPGDRTATGRRCSLHCCLETIPGFHYSHSNFCPANFNFQVSPVIVGQFAPILAAPSRVWSDSPENFTMPRLRQRMTCRRGASRGRTMGERPPHSSSDDFSSEPSERRSAQDNLDPPGLFHNSPATAPPLSTPPLHASAAPPLSSPPLHASAAPPHPGSHFLSQSSQRAELCFDCAFNRPSITTFITVTLREEASFHPPPPPDPLQAPLAPISDPSSGPGPAPCMPSPGVPLAPAPSSSEPFHLQMEADLSGEEGAKNAEAEPENPYGCRIEEEQPAPN